MNPPPIGGPYKFGDNPPLNLMGYAADIAEAEEVRLAKTFYQEPCSTVEPIEPPPPIWQSILRHNNGKHLPTVEQQTGDCVAAGCVHAGQYLSAHQILDRYEEELYAPWHVSFIYGISRVQVGGGQLVGPGSTGTWGALAVKQYGILFTTDQGAPLYSGSLSTKWGRRPGPPVRMQKLAYDNPVTETHRLHAIEEIRFELCSNRTVTIASNRGFRMKPYKDHGFHCWLPSGSWSHQMSLVGWMDDPFPAAYRLNSWGPDAHGRPLNSEPPGGAWNHAEDLEAELRGRGVEVYSYGTFAGEPAAADHQLVAKIEGLMPKRQP